MPRQPEESLAQQREPDSVRNPRIESQWRALERAQRRRTNFLGEVGLVAGVVLAAGGVAVARRNQMVGDAMLTAGLLVLPWAAVGLSRWPSGEGWSFLAQERILPATLASVAAAVVALGAVGWRYTGRAASGDALVSDDRVTRTCHSILLAGSLVYMFNVIVNALTIGGQGHQTVVGTWLGAVLNPEFPLPEHRLAYAVVLVGLGILLRRGRARGVAGGMLIGGYFALVLCILGALRWISDHPVSLWAAPVALVVLIAAVYQQSRRPVARSGGTF